MQTEEETLTDLQLLSTKIKTTSFRETPLRNHNSVITTLNGPEEKKVLNDSVITAKRNAERHFISRSERIGNDSKVSFACGDKDQACTTVPEILLTESQVPSSSHEESKEPPSVNLSH